MRNQLLIAAIAASICLLLWQAYDRKSAVAANGGLSIAQMSAKRATRDDLITPSPSHAEPRIVNQSLTVPKYNAPASELKQAMTSFEHSKDVYLFYKTASSSSVPGEVAQAAYAAAECHGIQKRTTDLGTIAGSTMTEAGGAISQERRNAISEVIRRCEGFGRLSVAQRKEAIRSAEARAQELGALELKYKEMDFTKLTKEDFNSLLQSASGASFEITLLSLSTVLRSNLVSLPKGNDIADTAAFLAICDLSKSCEKDSLRTLMGCALGGTCDQSLGGSWEQDFSAEERSKIEDIRGKVVDQVKHRIPVSIGFSN